MPDSTMYNGDGVRKCSHINNTTIVNKNTNNISATPKRSKLGVEVEVTNESVVANDSISLFKTTPTRENVGMWVIKTVFTFTTATTSNNNFCEKLLDWNNNTTTIHIHTYYYSKMFKSWSVGKSNG